MLVKFTFCALYSWWKFELFPMKLIVMNEQLFAILFMCVSPTPFTKNSFILYSNNIEKYYV